MTLEQVDLQQVKEELYKRLKPSGWANILKGFILSSDFDHILEYLYKENTDGRRFTPPLKYLFKAFEQCPYDKLHTIFILQDPYPYLGQASGIPMSCELIGKEQPSLKYVFDALQEMHTHETYKRDIDLSRWSNQGILLINTALTCELGKTGTHYDIWRPFIAYLLDMLNSCNMGLIFVFFGRVAQQFEPLIVDGRHYKLQCIHPAHAAYGKGIWNHKDIFPTIDTLIKKNYKLDFIW